MYTKTAFISAWPVLGAAIMAGTLFAGAAAAKDKEFTVSYAVSTHGLDLTDPAVAHELYSRLQHAARVVCTHGRRVDLVPTADPGACYEKSLASAVRSADSKQVTQIYLATHTLEKAAALGIDLPVQIASK